MNNLKSSIRFFKDKPMNTIAHFILKSAGIKAADLVEFKVTVQGGA